MKVEKGKSMKDAEKAGQRGWEKQEVAVSRGTKEGRAYFKWQDFDHDFWSRNSS